MKRGRLNIKLTCLYLGKVKNIIDYAKQRIGGRLHLTDIILLLWGQLSIQGQMAHAENGIHGGTDLVGHVGQKI